MLDLKKISIILYKIKNQKNLNKSYKTKQNKYKSYNRMFLRKKTISKVKGMINKIKVKPYKN